MRIIHAPKDPAGLATTLAEAERRAGHDVTTITTRASFTGVAPDICHNLQDTSGVRYVVGHVQAARSLPAADVIHLWFGASFIHFPRFGMSLVDLPYLSRRAPVVVSYVGSDARPGLDAAQSMAARSASYSQRRSIDKMAEHAHRIFAYNPDLLRYLPTEMTEFVPYAVATPVVSSDLALGGRERNQRPLRVLHAPTSRSKKGTHHVLGAIERVEAVLPGAIEFQLVEHTDRATFLAKLQNADLFIDQLMIGWYGVSAVEAMLLKTPVMCFVNDTDLDAIPAQMAKELSIIRVDQTTIERQLLQVLAERDQLAEVARSAHFYATKWHDPALVAQTTLTRYQEVYR